MQMTIPNVNEQGDRPVLEFLADFTQQVEFLAIGILLGGFLMALVLRICLVA